MGVDARMTFGKAGLAGTAMVCGFRVAGIAGGTGCAGPVGAGCDTRDMRSGRGLQCGCCGVWDSVSGLDTVSMQVLSHAAVNSTNTGVYLVAVLG